MSVVTKSRFLKILEARQGCCTQEDKGGKWRQDPGRGGHIRVKKKEGRYCRRPASSHSRCVAIGTKGKNEAGRGSQCLTTRS